MLPFIALLALVTANPSAPSVQLNDNTSPAGHVESGRLTVSLVVSMGAWKPEGPDGAEHQVAVFGEEGRPPSNPGPLIRTRSGTTVTVTVRNALSQDISVHGLCARPGPCPDVALKAGESRRLDFTLSTPGTYAYWAGLGATALDDRALVDSQLGGVIIVDPQGTVAPDRIFVLSILTDPAHEDDLTLPFVLAINGASWPYTERLQFHTGEHVRFRLANLSYEPHAMHLHGFHFLVEAEGDGLVDRHIPAVERQL